MYAIPDILELILLFILHLSLLWIYIQSIHSFLDGKKTYCDCNSLLTRTNLVKEKKKKKDVPNFSNTTACSIVLPQTPGHPSQCLMLHSPLFEHGIASLPRRITCCRATNRLSDSSFTMVMAFAFAVFLGHFLPFICLNVTSILS